jgi:hypothetical protein
LYSEAISLRVQSFARELEQLVHAQALAAVQAALGGASMPRPTAPVSSLRAPAKPAGAKKPRAAKKAARKSGAAVAADAKIVAHVKEHPGLRLEVIAKGLGVPSPKLKQRVADLVASKALRKEGKTRGTTYFVA